jgi:hypothetical protein
MLFSSGYAYILYPNYLILFNYVEDKSCFKSPERREKIITLPRVTEAYFTYVYTTR